MQFIQQLAQGTYDVDVGALGASTDVIGFTHATARKDLADRSAVVGHVEPVAHIEPIAVDRQILAGHGILNDQRYQLFRKLIGAIVVGTVRRQYRQPVRVVIGAHQMIGCSFGRGIRTVGQILVCFAKRRIARGQRSIYLVRRYVQKAKLRALVPGQVFPVRACGFQQGECAIDVGANELGWTMDGTVHVALGGEVHDRTRLMSPQQR